MGERPPVSCDLQRAQPACHSWEGARETRPPLPASGGLTGQTQSRGQGKLLMKCTVKFMQVGSRDSKQRRKGDGGSAGARGRQRTWKHHFGTAMKNSWFCYRTLS